MFKYSVVSSHKGWSPSRERKFKTLLNEGFLPWELRQSHHKSTLTKLPLHQAQQDMRAFRVGYLHKFEQEAKRKDWTKTEAQRIYRRRLDKLYVRKGWVTKDGKKSAWAMYHWFLDKIPPEDRDYPKPTNKRRRKVSGKEIRKALR